MRKQLLQRFIRQILLLAVVGLLAQLAAFWVPVARYFVVCFSNGVFTVPRILGITKHLVKWPFLPSFSSRQD